MALVKWSPRRLLDVSDGFDRAFDAFFPAYFGTARRDGWYPAIDVHEDGESIAVTVEVPGVREGDLELHVQDNVLTLRGEKRAETERADEKRNVYYAERQYGRFERSFSLPSYVDAENAQASFRDGVLTVTLPKREQHKTRTIPITTG